MMWQFLSRVKAHVRARLHYTTPNNAHFCHVHVHTLCTCTHIENGWVVLHTDRQFWHRCSKRKNVVVILQQCEGHGRGLDGKVTVSLALDLRAVDGVVGIHRLRIELTWSRSACNHNLHYVARLQAIESILVLAMWIHYLYNRCRILLNSFGAVMQNSLTKAHARVEERFDHLTHFVLRQVASFYRRQLIKLFYSCTCTCS